MATERDLSALLPAPPPPRPDRREAAIDAAMRRFDGVPSAPAQPPHRWRIASRPQLGALAAAALVMAVGLPLWLAGENRSPSSVHSSEALDLPASKPPASDTAADVAPEPPADVIASPPPGIVALPAPSPAERASPGEAARSNTFDTAAPAPPPASLVAPSPPPPPLPPAPVQQAAEDAADVGSEVIVTGARIGRAAKTRARIEERAAARGDWNACTVDDPRQNLAACRKALPAAAPGATGRAAALVSDGLTQAWEGDTTGAVAAFDRAIAQSPKLAAAYLNRGLVLAQEGDDAAALADLDQAVRHAPNSARTWFQRSRILRRMGKTDRADVDAARAAALDPRYEDLVE